MRRGSFLFIAPASSFHTKRLCGPRPEPLAEPLDECNARPSTLRRNRFALGFHMQRAFQTSHPPLPLLLPHGHNGAPPHPSFVVNAVNHFWDSHHHWAVVQHDAPVVSLAAPLFWTASPSRWVAVTPSLALDEIPQPKTAAAHRAEQKPVAPRTNSLQLLLHVYARLEPVRQPLTSTMLTAHLTFSSAEDRLTERAMHLPRRVRRRAAENASSSSQRFFPLFYSADQISASLPSSRVPCTQVLGVYTDRDLCEDHRLSPRHGTKPESKAEKPPAYTGPHHHHHHHQQEEEEEEFDFASASAAPAMGSSSCAALPHRTYVFWRDAGAAASTSPIPRTTAPSHRYRKKQEKKAGQGEVKAVDCHSSDRFSLPVGRQSCLVDISTERVHIESAMHLLQGQLKATDACECEIEQQLEDVLHEAEDVLSDVSSLAIFFSPSVYANRVTRRQPSAATTPVRSSPRSLLARVLAGAEKSLEALRTNGVRGFHCVEEGHAMRRTAPVEPGENEWEGRFPNGPLHRVWNGDVWVLETDEQLLHTLEAIYRKEWMEHEPPPLQDQSGFLSQRVDSHSNTGGSSTPEERKAGVPSLASVPRAWVPPHWRVGFRRMFLPLQPPPPPPSSPSRHDERSTAVVLPTSWHVVLTRRWEVLPAGSYLEHVHRLVEQQYTPFSLKDGEEPPRQGAIQCGQRRQAGEGGASAATGAKSLLPFPTASSNRRFYQQLGRRTAPYDALSGLPLLRKHRVPEAYLDHAVWKEERKEEEARGGDERHTSHQKPQKPHGDQRESNEATESPQSARTREKERCQAVLRPYQSSAYSGHYCWVPQSEDPRRRLVLGLGEPEAPPFTTLLSRSSTSPSPLPVGRVSLPSYVTITGFLRQDPPMWFVSAVMQTALWRERMQRQGECLADTSSCQRAVSELLLQCFPVSPMPPESYPSSVQELRERFTVEVLMTSPSPESSTGEPCCQWNRFVIPDGESLGVNHLYSFRHRTEIHELLQRMDPEAESLADVASHRTGPEEEETIQVVEVRAALCWLAQLSHSSAARTCAVSPEAGESAPLPAPVDGIRFWGVVAARWCVWAGVDSTAVLSPTAMAAGLAEAWGGEASSPPHPPVGWSPAAYRAALEGIEPSLRHKICRLLIPEPLLTTSPEIDTGMTTDTPVDPSPLRQEAAPDAATEREDDSVDWEVRCVGEDEHLAHTEAEQSPLSNASKRGATSRSGGLAEAVRDVRRGGGARHDVLWWSRLLAALRRDEGPTHSAAGYTTHSAAGYTSHSAAVLPQRFTWDELPLLTVVHSAAMDRWERQWSRWTGFLRAFEAEDNSVRQLATHLRLRQQSWTSSSTLEEQQQQQTDAVEGFWARRPVPLQAYHRLAASPLPLHRRATSSSTLSKDERISASEHSPHPTLRHDDATSTTTDLPPPRSDTPVPPHTRFIITPDLHLLTLTIPQCHYYTNASNLAFTAATSTRP